MQVEKLKIDEIKEYSNNPRNSENSLELVKKSINSFGFKVPILIDKKNIIIAGHTRFKAAKELGLTEVPIIRVEDLTDDQITAFRIMDNKSQQHTTWDNKKLADEFYKLEESTFEMDLSGFSDFEISQIWDNQMDVKVTDFKKIQVKLIFDDSEILKEVYSKIAPILSEYSVKVKADKKAKLVLNEETNY